ncbi:hypothetical protein ABZ820_29670 [Streptomyces diacarni]|uniref:hypothetical protein n=1 Tax=Streptomyces diacarni TaxID=2800381 RepID=UPI0015F0F502|nr:hypothetical protein [Streptomyces diacarni]
MVRAGPTVERVVGAAGEVGLDQPHEETPGAGTEQHRYQHQHRTNKEIASHE